MKNNVNPVAIGMFVLAAAVISVAAVMVFGAAKFFAKTEIFISYFSESVNGLDVGAPLKYKGVTIGKVERIMVATAREIRESKVAVLYSIDVNLFKRRTGKDIRDFDNWVGRQIEKGLRAKLNYQSIVTGMLYIELDFLEEPNTPYKTHYQGNRDIVEIPASESGLAELVKAMEKTIEQISEIDFKSIGKNADGLLANLNAIAANPDTQALPSKISNLVAHVDAIVLDPEVRAAPKNLNKLFGETSDLMRSTEREITALSKAGQTTFSNVDSVLKNVNTIVAPHSPLRYEIAVLIRTLNESLTSISNLTDYIERNPSSIITGKVKSKEQKK